MKTGFVTLLMIGIAMGQQKTNMCPNACSCSVATRKPVWCAKPAKKKPLASGSANGQAICMTLLEDGTVDQRPCPGPNLNVATVPPLDVPAIRVVKITPMMIGADRREIDWTCPDPDAYSLQISVSGKAANCHRITP